ncbi:MAG: hypothetical protein ACRD50_02660 [Candidatus Acidiferrales bacterium]
MRKWWCADCIQPTQIDKHGRCGVCGSNAIDAAQRHATFCEETVPPQETPAQAFAQFAGAN